MKICATVLLLAIGLPSQSATWVPQPAWTTRDSKIVPLAIAIDPQGNVLVTGNAWFGPIFPNPIAGFVTAKYGRDGTPLWINPYVGPTGNGETPVAVGVDAEGNVYATGQSLGFSGNFDIVTLKYDPEGKQLWAARYNGPADRGDQPVAMNVSARGEVWIAALSVGSNQEDFLALKYDSAGTLLWSARYNGPGNGSDKPVGLAVDANGNVYLAGPSQGAANLDYVTIKYDSEGTRLWVARYDGPGQGDDKLAALALDRSTNILVTGSSYGGQETDFDIATIKYDAQGKELWVARLDGVLHGSDGSKAIATDPTGNVFVTGRAAERLSDGYKYSVMTTLKYDPNGNQLWRTNSNAYSGDYLVVDRAGNALVAGYVGAGCGVRPCSAATVTKYDPDGQHLGSKSDGGGSGITAIAFDAEGNFYTLGFLAYPVNFIGGVIAKYLESPTDQPTITLTTPISGSSYDQPVDVRLQAVATASQGRIASVEFHHATGSIGFAKREPFSESYFTLIWTNAPAGEHTIAAVATDDQGRSSRSSGVLITVRTNIPPTVTLTSPTTASQFVAPAAISVAAAAADSDGAVTQVEFFEGPTLIGIVTASPYVVTLPGTPAGTYVFQAVAKDRLGAKGQSGPVEITVTGAPAVQTPFNGKPLPVPGRIEAEQFDRGGEGVAFYDLSSGGPSSYRDDASVEIEPCTDTGGGHNVARFRPGEWLEYTIDVADAGLYVVELRLSCPNGGGWLHLEINRKDKTGPIRVPFTGSGQNWFTTRLFIPLERGVQALRVAMDSPERETQLDGSINYLHIFSQGTVGTFYLPAAPADGRLKLRLRPDEFFSTASAYWYVLQASTNWVDWVPVATNQTINGMVDFDEQSTTNYPLRFFRAQYVPGP